MIVGKTGSFRAQEVSRTVLGTLSLWALLRLCPFSRWLLFPILIKLLMLFLKWICFLPQALAPLSFSTNALPSPKDERLHLGQAPAQMSSHCGLPWLHPRFYSLFIKAMPSPSLYGYNKSSLLSLDFHIYSLLLEECLKLCHELYHLQNWCHTLLNLHCHWTLFSKTTHNFTSINLF